MFPYIQIANNLDRIVSLQQDNAPPHFNVTDSVFLSASLQYRWKGRIRRVE